MKYFAATAGWQLAFGLFVFSMMGMPRARAELLRYSLLFALGRVKIQGRKDFITDADRAQIADDVIASFSSTATPGGSGSQCRRRH